MRVVSVETHLVVPEHVLQRAHLRAPVLLELTAHRPAGTDSQKLNETNLPQNINSTDQSTVSGLVPITAYLKGQLVSCSFLPGTARLSGQPRSPYLQGRESRERRRSRPRLGDSRNVC